MDYCDLHLHVAAYHASGNFESFVPGIGAMCETDWKDLRVDSGVFRNSERGVSFYATGIYQPIHIGPVKIGAALGAVTGYKKHPILPLGGLAFSVEQGEIEHHILVIPKIEKVTPLTIQYSFTVKF